MQVQKIEYEDEGLPTDNEKDDNPILQGRDMSFLGNMFPGGINFGGGRVSIGNMGGVNIRARNPNKQLSVNISNNKVMIGGKVICEDIRKKLATTTYQKTSDGTLWHTNLPVGEPMTQTEIDDFEKEWAEYERVREVERKKREEERERERKQREEERERERKQREAERKQREEERERERREREEQRESERKERDELREKERREREAERKRQEEERENEQRERESERKRQEEGREREREKREAERKQRDEESEKERNQRDEDREIKTIERDGEKRKSRKDSNNINSNIGNSVINIGGLNMSSRGGRVSVVNSFNGLTIKARNPKKKLSVSMNNNRLFVGDRVIKNVSHQKIAKPTYQKTSDGTLWYTNLTVGEPMTQEEIDDFEKEWAEYEEVSEAERKQRKIEREREREERGKEREKARKEKERERREKERMREEKEAEKKQRREERERERREREEEREKIRKSLRKTNTGRGRSVERTSSPGKRRSNAGVNMTDPFRSDFMVGFDPFAED